MSRSKRTANKSTSMPKAAGSGGVLMKTAVTEAESERRLRPVYEALFAEKGKQALKLSNQAIQKRPGWPAARALRACALLQLGQRADALAAVAQVRKDIDAGRVPVDEDAAIKLAIFYRDVRAEHLAAEVYEQAWQVDHGTVRLAEVAFGLYVRARHFSEAHKIALKLQRELPRKANHYALWVAASTWLELQLLRTAADETEGLDPRILTLAAKRVTKALEENSLPTSEVVRFAVRLYIDAREFEVAKALLMRPRILMEAAELLRLRALVEKRAGRTEEAAELYRQLVTDIDADDWSSWAQYFSLVKLEDDSVVQVAWETVNEGCEIGKTKKRKYRLRGPFLARLELLLRLREYDRLRKQVVDYFRMFARKSVCAADLRPYVHYLQQADELGDLFDELETIMKENENSATRISLSWLQLWFDNLEVSVEYLISQYTTLVDGKLEQTERQQGDEYLLMAVHKLLPASNEKRYEDSGGMLQSLIILEHGLSKSPHNYHFKLLLIVLYTQLKYTERAFSIWTSLGIKHIQLATLTHLVLEPLFASLNYADLRELFDHVRTLWRECDKDIPEGISRAFQAGSINAAADFLLFRRRVERTAVLAQCMHLETLSLLPDQIGDAWMVIGEAPRFRGDKAERGAGLILNRDTRCLDFWNTNCYDAETRLRDEDDVKIEMGEFIPQVDQDAIFSKIVATRRIVAMAHGVAPQNVGDVPLNAKLDSMASHEMRRVHFVRLLCELLCDIRRSLDVRSIETGNIDRAEVTEVLVRYLDETSEELKTRVDGCESIEKYSSEFATILGDICVLVGDVMQLIFVGLQSMAPFKAQKKKPGHKSGKVANGHLSAMKGIENGLAELRKAAKAGCLKIAEALREIDKFRWASQIDLECLFSNMPKQVSIGSYASDSMTGSGVQCARELRKLVADSQHKVAKRAIEALEKMGRKFS